MPWKPNAWSLFWLTGPERGWVAGPASSDSAYSSSWRPRAPSRGASRIQKSESSPLAGLGARADSLFSLLTRSHASMYRLRSSALASWLLIARGVGMGTSGRVFLVTHSASVDLVQSFKGLSVWRTEQRAVRYISEIHILKYSDKTFSFPKLRFIQLLCQNES